MYNSRANVSVLIDENIFQTYLVERVEQVSALCLGEAKWARTLLKSRVNFNLGTFTENGAGRGRTFVRYQLYNVCPGPGPTHMTKCVRGS